MTPQQFIHDTYRKDSMPQMNRKENKKRKNHCEFARSETYCPFYPLENPLQTQTIEQQFAKIRGGLSQTELHQSLYHRACPLPADEQVLSPDKPIAEPIYRSCAFVPQRAAPPLLPSSSSEEVSSRVFPSLKRSKTIIKKAIFSLPNPHPPEENQFSSEQQLSPSPSHLEPLSTQQSFFPISQALIDKTAALVDAWATKPLLNQQAENLVLNPDEMIEAVLKKLSSSCSDSKQIFLPQLDFQQDCGHESVQEKFDTANPRNDYSMAKEQPDVIFQCLRLLKMMITQIDHLHRQGDWKASLYNAEEVLVTIADLSLDEPDVKIYALFYKAEALRYLFRYKESIAVADQILDLIQKGFVITADFHVKTLVCKAISLEYLKRWVESLACAKRALDLDPANFFALNCRGTAECKLKQWENAFATSAILLKDQNNLEGLLLRARAFAGICQWIDVLNTVSSIHNAFPRIAATLVLEAQALLHLKESIRAFDTIQQAIQMQGHRGEALKCKKNILATISDECIDKGDLQSALSYIDQAISLFPSSILLLQRKIYILSALHDVAKAIKLCEKALELCEARLQSRTLSHGNHLELEHRKMWLITSLKQLK